MNPQLMAVLHTFVGGELEVKNPFPPGYLLRGEIAAVEIVAATTGTFASLKVTLAWNAKAAGEPTGLEFLSFESLAMGEWEEIAELEYCCNIELPAATAEQSISNVQLSHGRMVIQNPYTHEITVLYPRDGSKLVQGNVRWLPDGPKTTHDATRSTGETAQS